jgi:protein O-mannosyl-transferase
MGMNSWPASLQDPRFQLVVVLALVAMVYTNSLDNSFHFDDEHSIVANPHIRELGNIPAFFTNSQMFSRNPGSEMYRPLVLVSYALNYRLGKYRPGGYHLFNTGIHLLVVLMLFGLFVQFGFRPEAALAGSLLFGIFPLTSEPVNYISSRSESLAALFFLGSLLFYMRKEGQISPASLLFFAAGLLCKSVVLTLPALLLLYDWAWGKWKGVDFWRSHWPYWVGAAVYVGGISSLVREAIIQAPVRSMVDQAATQVKALIYYAQLLFFPQPLNVEHQFFAATGWGEGAVLLGGICVLSLAFVLSRGGRECVFWCGWVIIGLLPTLIVPLNVMMNERRLYLPLVGFIGFLMCMVRLGEWRRNSGILFGVGGILLAVLTVQRNQIWKDEGTLWRDALEKSPGMVRPLLRVGSLNRAEGRFGEAEKAYLKALKLDLESAPAYNNLGNLYREQERLEAAEQAYAKALGIAPRYVEAQINLGTLYSRQGRLDEAVEIFQRALPLAGNREEIHNNLGTAYLRKGDFSRAERELRAALALNPDQPRIHFNLGGALEEQGRWEEAVAAYQRAVELQTSYAGAYYKLGILFEKMEEKEKAGWAYRNFLRFWRGDSSFLEEARERLRKLADSPPRR